MESVQPFTTLRSLFDAMWGGTSPEAVRFQLFCTDSISAQSEEVIEAALRPIADHFRVADFGRVELLHYDEPPEFPDMTLGPIVMTRAGPVAEARLTKKIIPPGFYLLFATADGERESHARLQCMRSTVCSVYGRAGAYHLMHDAVLKIEDGEEKFSAATNAIEMPQHGFRAVIRDAGLTADIANALSVASQSSQFASPLSIFNAALDQTDLSAKHMLYWSAMESVVGGPNRLGNTLAAAYGTTPQHLDDLLPFRRLKDERDAVAHRGVPSKLRQADERILHCIFVDLLIFALNRGSVRLAQRMSAALNEAPSA